MKPYYQQHSPLDQETPSWYHGRWIFTKGLLLGLLILALASAALLLLGKNHKEDELGTHGWGGSVSPSLPEGQANAVPATPDTVPEGVNTPPSNGVSDSLRSAQASLDQSNLLDGRAANDAALAHDANNRDTRGMQRGIVTREQRRDDALRGAELCATQSAWACVQRQASEALAIDPGNERAQSLMERAILATAWKPLTPWTPPHSAAPATAAAVPLPRGGAKAAPLPSSRDWDDQGDRVAHRPVTSKDWPDSAPPLPGARIHVNPTNLAGANSPALAAAADQPDVAGVAIPASSASDVDPRERAILQSGWEHPAPSAAH